MVTFGTFFYLKSTTSYYSTAEALSRHLATASFIASEVMVAPDTASTFGDCVSIISSGIVLIATPPLSGVSLLLPMLYLIFYHLLL